MPATLDDIAAMVTFARVVRTRSFSTAARELDLSKSAVSSSGWRPWRSGSGCGC